MSDDGETRSDQRWNPGSRYRPSVLAARSASECEHPGPHLSGRLFRGPARRTAVFDRAVWQPGAVRPQAVATLSAALRRYRRGEESTTGLVRAVGRSLAS